MPDHVYKILELTGSSRNSIEDAVQNAISRAAQTIRNMQWFEVTETRGHINGARIAHWQVTVKVGFTLEDASAVARLPVKRSAPARRRAA